MGCVSKNHYRVTQGKIMGQNLRKIGCSLFISAVAGASLLSAPAPVCAHDIWLTADKSGETRTAQVNFGDTDDRSQADVRRIVTLELIDANGHRDLRHPLKEASRLGRPVLETQSFKAPANALLAVSYDNGFWLKIPGDMKETNVVSLMVPNGVSRHWTVKYSKILLGPGSFSGRVHSRLELSALEDPFTVPAGSNLHVKLELDGKPVAGARVAYGDGIQPIPDAKMPSVKTGTDGVAQIPLARRGSYLLTTDPEVAPMHPALAEKDHVFASLTFDLSP
jgi:nickel transport protein